MVTLILLFVVVCWVVYWAVIAPIVSLRLIPHKGIYNDLALYTEGTYKQFQDANVFDTYIQTFDFPEGTEIVAFYYIDNSILDNPIYGKGCDVFSVDYRLPQSVFEEYSTALSNQGDYLCNRQNFKLYYVDAPVGDNYGTAVALNEDEAIVRCCLVTSIGKQLTKEEAAETTKGQILYRTSLDWGK